jgi:hypothetical protein
MAYSKSLGFLRILYQFGYVGYGIGAALMNQAFERGKHQSATNVRTSSVASSCACAAISCVTSPGRFSRLIFSAFVSGDHESSLVQLSEKHLVVSRAPNFHRSNGIPKRKPLLV